MNSLAMPIQILIADDNEVSRGRLSELLSDHDGWKVCAAAENGQEALAKALEIKPDLIILDLAMPVMDSLRATREILQVMPQVPILIYTLHSGTGWLEVEAKKAGARKVIAKPEVQSLLKEMERLLATEPTVLPQGVTPAAIATGVIAAAESTPLEVQASRPKRPPPHKPK